MVREARVERRTSETNITVEVCLDGSGKSDVATGIGFLDHIIKTLTFHASFNLNLKASGDLQHHVIEDVAISLGSCISKALGDRVGIRRFGYAIVPMDDVLALASIDLVRRPFAIINLKLDNPYVEGINKHDLIHFFRSLSISMEATVHLNVMYGEDDHHKVEAITKALGISMKEAIKVVGERGYESIKGLL